MKKVVKKPSRDFTAERSRTFSSSTAATARRASSRAASSAGTPATKPRRVQIAKGSANAR